MAVVQKRYWVVFGLLIGAIAYQHVLSRESDLLSEHAELQGVPYQVGSWQGTDQPMEQRILDVLGLDAYIQRRYVDNDNRILWLYVGYYLNQRQGKGIHSPKHCYPGAGWSLIGKGIESIPLGAGDHESVRVNRLIFQKDAAKQVVLYWYQSGDRIMHSEYTQRTYLVLDAILFNRTDGALVKISTPLIGDLTEVLEYQKEFIKRIYPSLKRSLPGERWS
jgi:EpsI family protein